MQKLHLVMGGRVADPQGLQFTDLDKIDLVWSDLLDPVKDLWLDHLHKTEDLVYLTECKLGLRKPPAEMPDIPAEATINTTEFVSWVSRRHPDRYKALIDTGSPSLTVEMRGVMNQFRWVPDDSFNFDKRKAITSAIRRIAPNGQSNEIGMSCNIRALRHTVQLRTQRFAETEIRDIWGQIYCLVKARFPTIFYKAKEFIFDNLLEIRGMKVQPYEIEAGDTDALRFYTVNELQQEIAKRGSAA